MNDTLDRAFVRRASLVLAANPHRVLARSFVPGQELLVDSGSRSTGVLARVLALSEETVETTLRDVLARYEQRHRDFDAVLETNFDQIAHRIPGGTALSSARRRLVGAWFTHEYAVEGAALFNPSMIEHPDQSHLESGQLRFVMSLRAVGEGHLSSVEFRSGVVGPGIQLRLDPAGPHVELGQYRSGIQRRDLFVDKLRAARANPEIIAILVGALPVEFRVEDLEGALAALALEQHTRAGASRTAALARRVADCSYDVEFDAASQLSERVLWPHAPSESHGMEDVRFVRALAADGSVSYRATYTAFDGSVVEPQLIETVDFRRFQISPFAGPAAANKGLALFPRLVAGRHLALSRWDRESISVTSSADGRWWEGAEPLYGPTQPWELTQIGNCGSPIETDAGWVVLTHGVGPMREYAIGALLLDLENPTRILGALANPLLTPNIEEREGYVPNVVYSCGALRHGDLLLVPYGASDSCVRFAFVALPELLSRLLAGSPASTRANSAA